MQPPNQQPPNQIAPFTSSPSPDDHDSPHSTLQVIPTTITLPWKLVVRLAMNSARDTFNLSLDQIYRQRLYVPIEIAECLKACDPYEDFIHIEMPHSQWNQEDQAVIYMMDTWKHSLEKLQRAKQKQDHSIEQSGLKKKLIFVLIKAIKRKLRTIEVILSEQYVADMAADIILRFNLPSATSFYSDDKGKIIEEYKAEYERFVVGFNKLDQSEIQTQYVGGFYEQHVKDRSHDHCE